MSSPPTSNILLNPLSELTAALASSSFGILPPPTSRPLEEVCFPLTPEDLKSVEEESRRIRGISERVVGRAKVGLLAGEGEVVVKLDRSGWTIEQAQGGPELKAKLGRTYESLETLLIDASKAYVEAMNKEIWKRFEGHPQVVDGEGSDGE
ncbi:hypothetical protein IAT38_005172 [Cryptococcus sp. DSM 104549]